MHAECRIAGEGFISYRVGIKKRVMSSTRIDVQARIYFDTNAPIDTPAIFNTVGGAIFAPHVPRNALGS